MNEHSRHHRHRRIRQRIAGSAARPRVSVFRSARAVRLQFIDDEEGRTVLASATAPGRATVAGATELGRTAAEQAKQAGITTVVFDRGGYRYHGRVKAVAEGLREGGLTF